MSQPLAVLVTGGTGFVGSHVVDQLLKEGHTVRAVVRPGRQSALLSQFPDAGDKLQFVEVESLTSNYTKALSGVDAVIHTASPTFSAENPTIQGMLDGYHGTLSIVETAIASGVKKIVITGTIVSTWDLDWKKAFGNEQLTSKSFGSATVEDITATPSLLTAYQAAKTVADKKVWEIARGRLDVDITVIIPPNCYGPLIPNTILPEKIRSLSTIAFIHQLISKGPDTYPELIIGHMADVRDVAKAHILALSTPPLTDGRKKRFLVFSKTYNWKEVNELVREVHPELAPRLPALTTIPPVNTDAPVDTDFTAEVLGLKEYIPWKESILASLEECLRWEKKYGNT